MSRFGSERPEFLIRLNWAAEGAGCPLLYRKLNAEGEPKPALTIQCHSTSVDANCNKPGRSARVVADTYNNQMMTARNIFAGRSPEEALLSN